MIKQLHFKWMLLLCALMVGTNVAWAADKWVKTAPASLKTGDIVVIVDQTSSKAMSNNNGTSNAPSATAVTLNAGKDEITSTVATALQWNVTKTGSSYQFGVGESFLYVTSTNNGVRVGSGERNSFTIETGGDNNGYYLYNESDNDKRYIGCYTSDWRCYGTINNNIKGNNNAFYKKTAASGPVDPSLSITATKIAVGGNATISGPAGLTISYESDDTSIADVNDEGVVTGVAEGTATITATWAAVTDTYNAGSQDFTVTVVEPGIYEKVTSANQLVAGNKYIIVATENNKAMGAQNGSIRNPVDVTITDNKVTIIDEEVAELTLGGATDEWTFLASDNDKYLALTSASNALHASDDASADAAKWMVTNDFQLGSVGQSGRVLKYNSGSPRFACYTSSQQAATLFVKIGSKASLNINSACTDGKGNYYSTFSSDKAFVVPADLTVTEINASTGKLSLANYATGEIVPANTGVMVSSTTAGEHTVALATGGTSKLGVNNSLYATGDAGVTASDMTKAAGSGKYFYRLTMHNGSTLGFWWGAAEGAAFALAANKAYLAVPTSVMASGLTFGDEEVVTGISAVEHSTLNIEHSEVYNLNGQRVSQPTKGLYIVNGKKVVVK